MSSRRKRSWKKKRERNVYLGLLAAAIIFAAGMRLSLQFAVEVRFMFWLIIIALLIGVIVVVVKKSQH